MGSNEFGNGTVRRRTMRGLGVTLALALGLLLWARLKLVTDTPRMVYADPEAKQADGQPTDEPQAEMPAAPAPEAIPSVDR